MKIGIACCFRHRPEEDGPSTIPASTVAVREDMDEYARHCSPERPLIFPSIGYLGYTLDGQKMFWSFVKYEAPQQWHASYGYQSRGANIATCSVANLHCDQCGWSGVFPTKGGKDGSQICPWCGRRGAHSSPIKVPGDQFDEMLGDLRGPIEEAAKAAFADPALPEFAYPQLLVGGRIDPLGDVPPAIQGAAQAAGYGLRTAASCTLKDLQEMDPESSFLAIVPGVTSGVVDEESAKAGKSWTEGVCQYWLKLYVPDRPKVGFSFASVRF